MEGGWPPLKASGGTIGSVGRAGRRKDGRQRPDGASARSPACYTAATQLAELPVGRRKTQAQGVCRMMVKLLFQ